MRDTPFETNAELDQYFNHDRIQCLECGKRFKNLALHLPSHDMTRDDYREKWGIPAGRGLVGRATRERLAAGTNQRWRDGELTGEHLADAAKKIDYTSRAAKVAASDAAQKQSVADAKPWAENQLPDESTYADGRAALRRREYQRAYREQQDGDGSLMALYQKKYN